ncbi:MAG: hypothetical protein NT009_08990 [Proteobacteria bacterium]|nr:hypothetical protein [Pseudomonadota bacterium]
MKVLSLTAIGFCANIAIDQRKPSPFSLDDLYRASDSGTIVDLLQETIDDSGVIALLAGNPDEKRSVENALNNATGALRGRELRKYGIGDNPLCMVVAIVLEAIQQNF